MINLNKINLTDRFPAWMLFFLFLVVGLSAKSQDRISFSGRILDKATQKPLPFATIAVPQSQTGVISNEFGEFQYHIPEEFKNGVVMITYLGYKPIQINISDLKTGVLKVFKMEEQTSLLPEVSVGGIKGKVSADDVVFRAIRNIGKNYPDREVLYYGYYRDYIREANTSDYKNLVEAALIIDDKGFNKYDRPRTKIKLEQLRYNPDYEVQSDLNMAYDGKHKYVPYTNLKASNELSMLRAHDPIRNHDIRTFSYVYVFDTEFYINHKFLYESITRIGQDSIYCIHFDMQKKYENNLSEYNVDGHIYICSKSYAILKLIYSVTCITPTYTGKFFDLKLEYRDIGKKYYLNYLSLMNYFEFRGDSLSGDTQGKPFYQYRELFVNKIVNKAVRPFKPHEAINKSASLLTNKIPVIEGFWENYNFTGATKLQE